MGNVLRCTDDSKRERLNEMINARRDYNAQQMDALTRRINSLETEFKAFCASVRDSRRQDCIPVPDQASRTKEQIRHFINSKVSLLASQRQLMRQQANLEQLGTVMSTHAQTASDADIIKDFGRLIKNGSKIDVSGLDLEEAMTQWIDQNDAVSDAHASIQDGMQSVNDALDANTAGGMDDEQIDSLYDSLLAPRASTTHQADTYAETAQPTHGRSVQSILRSAPSIYGDGHDDRGGAQPGVGLEYVDEPESSIVAHLLRA